MRNHDPQIGRFIQLDPLSEEYVHNSTYAFSENKVTSHIELEGLEATPLPNFFKALQDEFVALGRKIDNTFSRTKTNDHKVSTKKEGIVEERKSVETKTESKLRFNAENWMSHVAQTNSNSGAPPLKIGIYNEVTVVDKTTITTKMDKTTIVGTQWVSRENGQVTTSLTVNNPIKLGVFPNATLGIGGSSNGDGTTATSATLSGGAKYNKVTYSAGTTISLTGQGGNNNTQIIFSVFGQSSSGKDINTISFSLKF